MPEAIAECKPQSLEVPAYAEHPGAHLRYVLSTTPTRPWPYIHALATGVFPSWYYESMLEHFPPDEAFHPLNADYPDRGAVYLTDVHGQSHDDLLRLDGERQRFWRAFAAEFGSRRMMRSLLGFVGGDGLVQRFGERCRPLMHLALDKRGYSIPPHSDIDLKIATFLFYLPEPGDAEVTRFGTSVLVPNASWTRARTREWDAYDVAATAPFSPNSMFCFLVGPETWHGVRPVDRGLRRRSIQYFIVQETEKKA
jgi:hypothetical protein